jgi:hypothetical protein
MDEKKICIFCGKKADVVKQGRLRMVICGHCNRETEQDEYKKIFEKWLDDIRKEASGVES